MQVQAWKYVSFKPPFIIVEAAWKSWQIELQIYLSYRSGTLRALISEHTNEFLPLHIWIEQLRYIVCQLMDAFDLIARQSLLPVFDVGAAVKFYGIDIAA